MYVITITITSKDDSNHTKYLKSPNIEFLKFGDDGFTSDPSALPLPTFNTSNTRAVVNY